MNGARHGLLAAAAAGIALVTFGGIAAAHPLGNFTINHYDGVRVGVDSLIVDHVVDMAEIPTFRERAAMDTDADGAVSDPEAAAYLATSCDRAAAQLDLRASGVRLPFEVIQRGLSFPMGQGALTTRLVCIYRAALPAPLDTGASPFTFRDTADVDRIGWREIVVESDGTTLARSDAPTVTLSARLTRYPTDLLTTPAAQLDASWSAESGGPSLGPFTVPDARPLDAVQAGAPVDGASAAVPNGISDLGADVAAIFQARELTLPVILLSLLVAAGLGALHAASPGHGKTVMAAYLVGSRGTSRQALGLGMTVTLSHTLGVLALGAVSLFASSLIAPERLYPILGTVSGTIVIAIGAWLVVGRLRVIRHERAEARAHAREHARAHEAGVEHDHLHALAPAAEHHAHEHEHGQAHDGTSHDHGDHGHGHGEDGDHGHGHCHQWEADARATGGWHSHGGVRHTHLPPSDSALSMRGLFVLGLAGGMVPSVSALILLLGSISLGRPAYGIGLTIAFGAGMAGVLVGVGVLLVRARGVIERMSARSMSLRLSRAVPTASPFVVLVAGVIITTQAVLTFR